MNTLIAVDYNSNNYPANTLPDAAQHLAGKSLFFKLDCSQAYHCLQMTDQHSMEMLAFNFSAELLPTKDLPKVLADLCLLLHVSCLSTWTQLSKLTNVISTWMISESQPSLLQTSPGTFGLSPSAFTKQY